VEEVRESVENADDGDWQIECMGATALRGQIRALVTPARARE
jgi:hypothetical protein